MDKEYAFENKIRSFCRQNELFSFGDRVLLGLSGGADSVCLFLVLSAMAKEWKLTLLPVHVNHNLRGAEAMEDQQFCEDLCKQYDCPLEVISVEVRALAQKEGWSLEEAGRNARYEAFRKLAQEKNCTKIAVAHHKDDQAETVLFRLFRGSRLKGLAGMECKNGAVVRPLLSVTREEIETYLKSKNQNFCTDSTNLEEAYTRNKIRHRIIPAATEVCTGAVEHIAELAEYAGQVEKLLQRLTKELFDAAAQFHGERGLSLKIEPLRSAEAVLADRVIYEALCHVYGRKKDITSGQVTDCRLLMEKQTGKYLTLPEGVVVRRTFDALWMEPVGEEPKPFAQEITEFPFRINLPHTGELFELFVEKRENLEENIPKSTYTKWFDYGKINKVMSLKTPESGDEMVVYTDGRKKSLADLLAEAKIPAQQRKGYPVLAAEKEILWIPGIRGSEGYRVTEETEYILVAKTDGGKKDGR